MPLFAFAVRLEFDQEAVLDQMSLKKKKSMSRKSITIIQRKYELHWLQTVNGAWKIERGTVIVTDGC